MNWIGEGFANDSFLACQEYWSVDTGLKGSRSQSAGYKLEDFYYHNEQLLQQTYILLTSIVVVE